MSAHTPGPWTFRSAINTMIGTWNYSVGPIDFSQRVGGKNFAEMEANARLIAAAPELLEALQNLENDNGIIPDHAWALVQAAIAKATGGQQ